MARPLPIHRSKPPSRSIYASEVLSDYEQWLLNQYGKVGTYRDHAKSFLRHFRDGGSLLSQLDSFAAKKSITGRSILNRFRKFIEQKQIRHLNNDLKKSDNTFPRTNALVKLYLVTNKDRLKSKSSQTTYATILNGYFDHIGELKHFEKVTAQQFIFAKNRSEFTSALYASVLKSFARWMLQYMTTPESELSAQERKIKMALGSVSIRSIRDVANVRAKTTTRKLYYKESLSKGQRDKLIAICASSEERSIVSLMAYNGLRPLEVERLTFSDLDFRKSTLAVWGKGRSRKEIIVLFRIVAKYLKAYVKGKKITKGKLFPQLTYKSLHGMIRALFKELKLPIKSERFSPHSLRHTAGQLLYDEGVPLEFIQRTLRHISMQSTLVYARKAIERSYFKQMKQVW